MGDNWRCVSYATSPDPYSPLELHFTSCFLPQLSPVLSHWLSLGVSHICRAPSCHGPLLMLQYFPPLFLLNCSSFRTLLKQHFLGESSLIRSTPYVRCLQYTDCVTVAIIYLFVQLLDVFLPSQWGQGFGLVLHTVEHSARHDVGAQCIYIEWINE